jgi:hypothetical protein
MDTTKVIKKKKSSTKTKKVSNWFALIIDAFNFYFVECYQEGIEEGQEGIKEGCCKVNGNILANTTFSARKFKLNMNVNLFIGLYNYDLIIHLSIIWND